ncbi:response regulator [Pedobacter metabolipauper]|uniref:Two-component system cell cycle response regulator DivK n=1 Tax=Pedobacter metabolipauper TaxID=425513 RepID=A0A4R6SUX2_9SPHI|nr:response regulator [Pedobacter metabolipauper]TDQ09628.1 two-component system cell cycle response regulator DivK [Pedobacter metabolipauper]
MSKNKKVFVFDDNTDILELCTIILEDAGYEIKTSATSNNIIDQVLSYTPDIIFMDNWLPDVGGIDATRALKGHETLKCIPVIYFSANNDVKALAEQAGADGYLSKPFDIQELEDIISLHLSA